MACEGSHVVGADRVHIVAGDADALVGVCQSIVHFSVISGNSEGNFTDIRRLEHVHTRTHTNGRIGHSPMHGSPE